MVATPVVSVRSNRCLDRVEAVSHGAVSERVEVDLEPGSVVQSMVETDPLGDGSDNYAVFLYLSFITLTSVGYGELTPYGAAARSVAVFTGLFGQLYVAILIAKLVGLYTAQSMKDSTR